MAGEEAVIVTLGVLITVTFVSLVMSYSARYKKVPPGHAMIVYGRRFPAGQDYMVVRGGGKFILPIIESFKLLSLEPIEIDLLAEDVVVNITGAGHDVRRLQVSMHGIARISDDVERLQRSARDLLNKTPAEIKRIVEKTLEGHTRGILAKEERPEQDIEAVAEKIRGSADADLARIGIGVSSLNLKIRDTAAMRGQSDTAFDHVARELHQLDTRLRRVEEKLGLSASGSLP